jgi:hypothetical protein
MPDMNYSREYCLPWQRPDRPRRAFRLKKCVDGYLIGQVEFCARMSDDAIGWLALGQQQA